MLSPTDSAVSATMRTSSKLPYRQRRRYSPYNSPKAPCSATAANMARAISRLHMRARSKS